MQNTKHGQLLHENVAHALEAAIHILGEAVTLEAPPGKLFTLLCSGYMGSLITFLNKQTERFINEGISLAIVNDL